MSEYTSFRIGGPADLLVTPRDEETLRRTVLWAVREAVPMTVIGRGTNLLVRDGGLPGLVLRIGEGLDDIDVSEGTIRAGAGVALGDLSRSASRRGLSGLAFACGIPGSLGGALVMNAGAHGGEMKDIVRRVQVLEADGGASWLDQSELGFGYRRSVLQGGGLIVLRGELGLRAGDRSAIEVEMERWTQKRAAKQPLEYPSAGSVFRRPEGHYVGPMITQAGLRGLRVGGAQVSEKHAGFIINRGGATAQDVLEVIDRIRRAVMDKFSVELVPEVRVIGEG
jgi:UDP-N-acetylmuramate dehydrogenase